MTSNGSSAITPTGRYSVTHLPRSWYVACLSRELRDRPVGKVIDGVPLTLFRDGAGRASALLDRCPHRNVPLSLGHCRDGLLECCYHGWRFDGAGACRLVPGLAADSDKTARRVQTFPVRERDGFVWVVPSLEPPMQADPPVAPHVGEPGYATVWRSMTMPGPLHAVLENALDVPHTAFLHRGLFRGRSEPVPVQVIVRHGDDRVEAEFVGEPRPPGIAAKVLSPDDGEVQHWDRFILPSIAQVEYRLGDSHLMITAAYTPIDDATTALHAAVTFKVRVPTPLVRAIVTPLAIWILRQDATILRQQRDNVRRFGGEQFANTPIDVLGPGILRLLRRAEREQQAAGSSPSEHDIELPSDEHVTLYT